MCEQRKSLFFTFVLSYSVEYFLLCSRISLVICVDHCTTINCTAVWSNANNKKYAAAIQWYFLSARQVYLCILMLNHAACLDNILYSVHFHSHVRSIKCYHIHKYLYSKFVFEHSPRFSSHPFFSASIPDINLVWD